MAVLRKDLGYRVYVLRLGHRVGRDKRVSTHVGLVARAFGASGIIYSGDEDRDLIESIADVVRRWGGDGFEVSYNPSWRRVIEDWRAMGGCVVHLTMYGIPVDEAMEAIRGCRDILVVVGSEKVPRDVYELSDYNVSIGSQPHSEVAALAVFLDRLFKGEELRLTYTDAKIIVIPSPRGKNVLEVDSVREEKTHHSS